MKTFRDFLEIDPQQLDEDSWLSKGFAIGQGSRHSSMKQSIASVLSNINSICERGRHEKDEAKKLDLLFQALQEFSRVFRGLTELSNSNINVSIASTLLSENLRQVIASELAKIERLKR